MLSFSEVSRSYGEKIAVQGFNLEVPSGELFALLGHNGAGKTTAIKMLVGLLRPGAGQVSVGGFDLIKETRQAASLIGYVPDQPYLYEKLSGREFLAFVAEMYGMEGDRLKAGIDREVQRFELAEFVDDLTESYSHGMKQRTVFAAAMLHHPRVLVVDEPLVGLDPHSIRLVKNLLREEVAAGTCVFMSTHMLSVAEEIADRIGVMRRGELLFQGTIEQLRQHQLQTRGGEQASSNSLEDLYLQMMEAGDSSAGEATA